jgi:phosphonate transport system substrate-binding protein
MRSEPSARPGRHSLGTLIRRLMLCALLLPCVAAVDVPEGAKTDTPDAPKPSLTFGILPIGGPSESLEAWRPMLDDMSKQLDRPISRLSVSTYEGISQAIGEHRVDVAFLSGRLALAAVTAQHMQVVAQLTRGDKSKGYYSVLLVPVDSPIHSLTDLFARPGHWRYARGEELSVSGYLVPEAQLFASRGLDSDTFFARVHVDNHQNNALAVANGEVDVAANNTADLERFQQHFPEQFARLRTLWQSSLIPHAVLVVRTDLPAPLQKQIADFLTGYGQGKGKDAELEEANLKRIHDISGFAAAGNAALAPFADIEYNLNRRHALTAQWVNEAARQSRLSKIEADHRHVIEQLNAAPPRTPQAPPH